MSTTTQAALHEQLQRSGLVAVDASGRDALIQAAHDLDLTVCIAACDKARSRSAVLRAVVKAVDFPEFFGSDLEALFDCLCDTLRDQKTGVLLWFDKLHSGHPMLAEDAEAIAPVCEDAAQFARNTHKIFAFAMDHTGKHADPEPGVAPAPYYSGEGEAVNTTSPS